MDCCSSLSKNLDEIILCVSTQEKIWKKLPLYSSGTYLVLNNSASFSAAVGKSTAESLMKFCWAFMLSCFFQFTESENLGASNVDSLSVVSHCAWPHTCKSVGVGIYRPLQLVVLLSAPGPQARMSAPNPRLICLKGRLIEREILSSSSLIRSPVPGSS